MPVRSDRLSGPGAVPALGTVELFTVPPLQTWIVRSILVFSVSGSASVWGLDLSIPPGGATRVHQARTDSFGHGSLEAWLAFDPGLKLDLVNFGATALNFVVCGAKLSGAAG